MVTSRDLPTEVRVSLPAARHEALLSLGMGEVRLDEPLARHTHFRAGGPVDAWVRVDDPDQVGLLRRWCRRERLPLRRVPSARGILVRDGGMTGIVAAAGPAASSALAEQLGQLDGFDERAGPEIPTSRAWLFRDPDLGTTASRLLGEAGLAGVRLRGARLSVEDANIVVNEGEATARDVLTLADWARRQVAARSGVSLELALVVVGRG